MTRKPDIKQFEQACAEVGLSHQQIIAASKDLHAEKKSIGERGHMPYQELCTWLRQWKRDSCRPS